MGESEVNQMCAYCAKWFPQTEMQQLPGERVWKLVLQKVFSRSVERTLEITLESKIGGETNESKVQRRQH
ncbi:hypothetical protein ACKC5O_20435, partial [Aeromonas schubertii]|uniref:hypothetical protein n=1 Tax=Aeromonas schubertii TaxID=652 RepID=UPI0038B68D6A